MELGSHGDHSAEYEKSGIPEDRIRYLSVLICMTSALRFRNHEQFHRAALHIAVAAPLAAIASAALPGGIAVTVGLASAAAAVAAMVAIRGSGKAPVVAGSLLAAVGAATLIATSQWGGGNAGLALFALIVALPMATGLRGRKLLLSVIAGAGALLIARLAAIQVMHAEDLASLPAWGSCALAGVAVSAASIFALVPRHLHIVRDPVATAHAQLQGRTNGETAELVERGNQLWSQAKAELAEDDTNLQILEEAVLRLMETAENWSKAAPNGTSQDAEKLAERMESLSDRIAKAEDKVVIKQYEQARAALGEQLKYISGINNNRERVLARMHNYLAAMERLRLAVANLKSSNASREAVDLTPIVECLEELGQDIDSCSSALEELQD